MRMSPSGVDESTVAAVAREPPTVSGARLAMQALWREPEACCVPPLIAAARLSAEQAQRAGALAARLIGEARRHAGVRVAPAALLRALALDSQTGVVLLSLAEALLRVPDDASADELIHDQLLRLGEGAGDASTPPVLRRALRLAARLGGPATTDAPGGAYRCPLSLLRRPTRALLRASMRAAVRWIGGQFVFATDIATAIRRARGGPAGWRYSFDMLGEAALTAAHAERYREAYAHAIRAVGAAAAGGAAAGVSVKLSALHPRYGYAQRGRILHELLPRLLELARLAQRHGVALTIDAEESDRLDLSLDLIDALTRDAALRDWSGLGVAVQAYQKRAPAVIDYLSALAAARAHPLRVRLVKGAYWDLEIKAAQIEGLSGYPVYTRKLHTDVAYLACARRILQDAHLSAQFATHNARTIADVLGLAADERCADPPPTEAARADARGAEPARPLEFQCLHGMGGGLYRHLTRLPARSAGVAPTICVYAPVGERRDLLPYLMRRLLENGAGNSFVHRATRASVSSLSADPVAAAALLGGAPHADIREPGELFAPERRNSSGLDLESDAVRARLALALEQSRQSLLEVRAVLGAPAASHSGHGSAHTYEIRNPANRAERIGVVQEADAGAVEAALAASVRGAREWAGTAPQRRAQLLEEAAGRFEQHCPALIALIVREAGRTLADAIGEVREAIDALRYYAAQIREPIDPAAQVPPVPPVPLGTVLCISPWNFPLAIFTGQIGAALAAGNAVLAKPAEQSTATASLAVQLLLEGGMPAAALQLLPGDGARVGMRMVADERVRGVLFTGSTATARAIARTLAGRSPVPLIAETGGQNAMIVDSSALPEQVVADALRSAFDSAGQRCSSLRVLCLQEEIASPVLEMLQGAMQELRVGDPARLETDIGPLIDEPARERIEAHVQSLRERLLCRVPLPASCERGVFFAPVLLRIDSVRELTGEVFGPVLHVLRFRRERLPELIDDINATGYGLTLGIASRIPGTIEAITQRARVGNVYVNRNMIGAVIGVQPFGGQGLSGTGPKAGGPLYLQALLARSAGPQWPPRGASGQPPVGMPAALRELIDWLKGACRLIGESERAWLRLRAEDYGRRTLLGARAALRGYVGESNELRLRARGRLCATARTLPALIEQLAAALATGNTLEVGRSGPAATQATTLLAALPPTLRDQLCLADQGTAGGPAGGPAGDTDHAQAVLVDAGDAIAEAAADPAADTHWLEALRVALASREGPIVPWVIGHADYGYPLERLLVEQTVTINTAAMGGDAQLLSLREDEGGAQAS
jgi:RHH-type transcriptional regulator, proline utilization regulon repressor / proline dehydrogenase / delta 1-pyrroline-5-carboxylate dehydrogenase